MKIQYLADVPEHADTCAQWDFETWGHYTPDVTLEKRQENYQKRCVQDSLPLTKLCMADGQLAGMVSLCPDDGLVWLVSLYIASSFRGRGLGATLTEDIEREALARGYDALYLITYQKDLVTWYDTQGWHTVKEDSVSGHPVTIMEKKLQILKEKTCQI